MESSDAEIQCVHHELELVKAALLYADTVEVLSLGNQMIRGITEFADGGREQMWALMGALDDDTLRYMAPGADLDQVGQAIALVSSADPHALRATPGLEGLADLVDQGNEMASSSMEDMREAFQQVKIDSGTEELDSAVVRKLVRVNKNVDVGKDSDAVIEAFAAELKRYLLDPTKFVLLARAFAASVGHGRHLRGKFASADVNERSRNVSGALAG